ncbi:PAC2 family protein [Halomontanus rarus]|uniref:PAC2 family protein n=1 Tax=Halomontanus rarus TaxID=3034020 RepID=UPI001A991566
MAENTSDATFVRETDLETTAPTLIEGLPGTGLVASIAADHISTRLDLERYGTIRSEEFPPVASFSDGLVQDTVRVYAGSDPDVMTLRSDVPIPSEAFRALSDCVLEELAEEFRRVIFLAGAPATSDEERGNVTGVGTTEALRTELEENEIPIAEEPGAVGDVTGALLNACYQADVPATLLLVQTSPKFPDPGAAKAVIETALEPLVEFDIETAALDEQAERIRRQKQQILQQQQEESAQSRSMFR